MNKNNDYYKFEYEITRDNGVIILAFKGDIIDETEFPPLEKISSTKELKIDFKFLTMINSTGIRDYINWLNTIPKDIKITYSKCPDLLINQINMLGSMKTDQTTIESIFIPYYCEECDIVINKLYKLENVKSVEDLKLEEMIDCTKCVKKAEVDIIPNKFFKFLKK